MSQVFKLQEAGQGPRRPTRQNSLLCSASGVAASKPGCEQPSPVSPVCSVARGLRGGSRSVLPRPSTSSRAGAAPPLDLFRKSRVEQRAPVSISGGGERVTDDPTLKNG